MVLGGLFCWGLNLLDSHERLLISPLFPSAARPDAAIFSTSLLRYARASVPAYRFFTRPLHLPAHLLVLSSSSILLFLSLVIRLVLLSRRFHLVVLRM